MPQRNRDKMHLETGRFQPPAPSIHLFDGVMPIPAEERCQPDVADPRSRQRRYEIGVGLERLDSDGKVEGSLRPRPGGRCRPECLASQNGSQAPDRHAAQETAAR